MRLLLVALPVRFGRYQPALALARGKRLFIPILSQKVQSQLTGSQLALARGGSLREVQQANQRPGAGVTAKPLNQKSAKIPGRERWFSGLLV